MNEIPVISPGKPGVQYETRPGAYGVIVDVDGKYFLPGGGLDTDETPEECLSREVLEELGLEVRRCEAIGEAIDHIYSPKMRRHYRIHGHFYRVQDFAWRTDPVDKGHVVRWLEPRDALGRMARPSQAWIMRKTLGMDA